MKKMESSINIKAKTRLHKAEIMIAVEQLRLHDGKRIKDRRYHLRTYPNYFVAQELRDWLISHKEALNQATAVCLMQHLMDHDIVHTMYPMFKDAKLLYCFRKDDGIFPFNTVKVFIQGQRLSKQDSMLQLREAQGVAYQCSFPGCQLIDWLLQNGKTESRRQGLELCRALLEHGIIHPVVRCYFLTFGPLHLAPELRSTLRHFLMSSLLFYNVFYKMLTGTVHTKWKLQTVMGDAVGWGFVVRGMAPVYIQAVDPGSPAAAAGVKVTQTNIVNPSRILWLLASN
uniref:Si:dkeyp-97e7.9 n=1 Tax=Hucho hucho TaxID=62062 RepID=A0A4W5JK97_9TELE